ncbi:hypothetical protein CVIRNUC_000560 [Coccomyxa viridis]|uniref:Phospholipase B-like n=1 Tax=Coccomyxa viridis TaxID=1274662 RepID=A0AAV1HQM3_9CHLO|nr:hypothetical protein CVIRNUC_000560 [Coccomyxa viridis]
MVKKGGAFAFRTGRTDRSVAYARYVDAAQTRSYTGQLHLSTSEAFSDHDQMFAAGYLEGYMTARRINEYYSNTFTYFTQGMNASLEKPLDWLEQQDRWSRSQVKDNGDSTLWRMLGLVLAQFDGIVAGYQARQAADPDALPDLSRRDLIFLNGNGEVCDLLEADLELQSTSNWIDLTKSPAQIFHDIALSGRCSALVTVTADFSNLFMGHSTWDSWSQITKIFKHYDFSLSLPGLASQRMSFSSYPGELFSDDDLYIMDSKLAVLSTTNHLYNTSLYGSLTHESLVSWQRVRVANALASSGEEWVSYLDYLNSGTYNN